MNLLPGCGPVATITRTGDILRCCSLTFSTHRLRWYSFVNSRTRQWRGKPLVDACNKFPGSRTMYLRPLLASNITGHRFDQVRVFREPALSDSGGSESRQQLTSDHGVKRKMRNRRNTLAERSSSRYEGLKASTALVDRNQALLEAHRLRL